RVTVFSRGFVPPRVWRASLDGQGVLQSGVMWSVSGSVLRGINQPVAFDLNLRPDAAFQNAAEGGRPVYVSPSAIDPATGLASLAASRRLSDLGTVREVTGMGRSRTVQFSASANKILGRLGILGWTYGGVGYTWTDARETVGAVSAPGGSAATTAGNATRLEWAPAGYAPRHVVQVYGSAIRSSRLALGLVANLASGTSFTPLVAGDVNGDGLVNDRAFIFDPRSAADPVVAQGMDRLLAAAPSGVRRCLRAQAGRVADHNGCRTRWSHSLDLNARLQFGSRLEDSPHRRVTFWVVASNVTAGLDYLLHRADGLRGWGQAAGVDNRLLTVRGFDPAARTFQYDVNPRFGSPSDQALLQRTPFSLSLQMRVVLGTDRPLRAFNEARDAMSNRVQAFAPANVRLHLERQLANAPAAVLALNAPERLYLEPAQALRLQQAADSIAPRIESVVSALVGLVAVTPGVVPAPVDADAVRGLAAEAVALRAAGLETVRSILSAEQWAKLPESLRSPGPGFVPYPPEQLTASSSY
ncbi:MAG TPA: hypothetical protein VFR37_09475, partial [Longimicrobium sp.]|nr:hypothetical protein [Longimicrobium sp.]